MKYALSLILGLSLITSCKKEAGIIDKQPRYINKVQAVLQDSLSSQDYAMLNFNSAWQSRINKDTSFLRIPIKSASPLQEFVLLQTNDDGIISRGRKISLSKEQSTGNHSTVYSYNGQIRIQTLQGVDLVRSVITNGYIAAFHPQMLLSSTAKETSLDGSMLPEVVVVAYLPPSGGVSSSDWMRLQSLFDGGNSGSSGYYNPISGPGGSGGSSGNSYTGSSDGNSITPDPPLLIDFENGISNPAIDVSQYINCFSSIPDAGASCSIEIFADIPVDTDPNKLFSLNTQSPGHTFIQIKKTNGGQSIMQNIGFYPQVNWKSIMTSAPVEGKFVDNGGHEYNAAIKMNVSSDDFQTILTKILYLSRFIKYDIDEYNCTDFALDVFNSVRTHKLEIPLYDIPGGITAAGTRTPQGLYNKLKQMKNDKDPEAGNINIGFLKGWVADSHGPCN